MMGINEKSVRFSIQSIDDLYNSDTITLEFILNNTREALALYPVFHEEEELIRTLEAIDVVFKVLLSDDGWLVIILDNSTSISFYADFTHKQVQQSKGINFVEPVDYGYESNDVNGDGEGDIIFLHNGVAQLTFIQPSL
ncbi:MAG: hypothetical protein KZQ83_11195 [gamma proteobacterium symbiont of Taylorina sp.]|nr:hypothetical protein [gamma proteobacterium symbiont of Taylorina sp.]